MVRFFRMTWVSYPGLRVTKNALVGADTRHRRPMSTFSAGCESSLRVGKRISIDEWVLIGFSGPPGPVPPETTANAGLE